jgi:phosphoketolase
MIIFNFHGYPSLIHRLAYRRTGHSNMHVRGYKEKGNINTPMELAINNEIDRFTLAIEVIGRTSKLQRIGRSRKKTTVISRPIAATTHTRTASTSRKSWPGDGRIRKYEKQAREVRSRYQGQNPPQNYRLPPM